MDDMAAIDSVVDRGADIRVPWLLVHGSDDDVVPLQDSQDIVARAPQATLVELPGVNHVFADDGLAPMIDAVVPWVRQRMEA
jgi:pimeloyl-ACP methyl ester carboxylesterase